MDSHFNSSFEEIICSFLEETILQKNKPLKPYHGSMDISIHIGYHRLIHYMKKKYFLIFRLGFRRFVCFFRFLFFDFILRGCFFLFVFFFGFFLPPC